MYTVEQIHDVPCHNLKYFLKSHIVCPTDPKKNENYFRVQIAPIRIMDCGGL